MSTNRLQEILELENEHLLQNYAPYDIVLEHGEGSYVWDTAGTRYLDFITGIGVNALGHGHPQIVSAITRQAKRLIHNSALYHNEFQGQLAKRLSEISGLKRAFFCNSGAEATECALKMMKAHGRAISRSKYQIVSLEQSFHGRTLGALSVTGQAKYREAFEPLLPGVNFVARNDLAGLEGAVKENTAGIFIECIQGQGGILRTDGEFCELARRLANRFDALLCFDETQCGVGRTGEYFAFQLLEPAVLPDILTAAKPAACGIPFGFVTANDRAATSIRSGMHGSTFGGNALATCVALEFFGVLSELLPQIRRVGRYLKNELEQLKAEFRGIEDVRTFGLLTGIQLTMPAREIVLHSMREGLLIDSTQGNILRLLPPYITTEAHVDEAIAILRTVFCRLQV